MTLLADFVTGQSNVSYTRMRKLMFAHALQEGVVAPGDFKTTQRSAGANSDSGRAGHERRISELPDRGGRDP
jgi:hypothetical protein